MHHEAADEIQALRLSMQTARERGWQWRPPYWIILQDGAWEVHAENEWVIRVDAATGTVLPTDDALDPLAALAAAREYAVSHGLRWKPAFSLELRRGEWIVGSCQSRLGGQVHIHVDHRSNVVKHWVNPK